MSGATEARVSRGQAPLTNKENPHSLFLLITDLMMRISHLPFPLFFLYPTLLNGLWIPGQMGPSSAIGQQSTLVSRLCRGACQLLQSMAETFESAREVDFDDRNFISNNDDGDYFPSSINDAAWDKRDDDMIVFQPILHQPTLKTIFRHLSNAPWAEQEV
jgi:hypothetical protein